MENLLLFYKVNNSLSELKYTLHITISLLSLAVPLTKNNEPLFRISLNAFYNNYFVNYKLGRFIYAAHLVENNPSKGEH